jgi:ElaB/YqjD/DUF883 family membrane-anchored ribosome-binding protein
MATAARRVIRRVEDTSDDISDHLSHQIAALRREIATIADAVNDYGGHTFDDVQHNAVALAKEVRHQGAVVGRQVSRQAKVAGRAVQENPIPVIVTLATIALLSALLFSRD